MVCTERHIWTFTAHCPERELSGTRAVILVSDGEILSISLLSKSTGITVCRFSRLPIALKHTSPSSKVQLSSELCQGLWRQAGGRQSVLLSQSVLPITAIPSKVRGILGIPGELQLKAKVRVTLMT